MKAAVYDHYGAPGVVRVADVEKPSPRNNEVLIRVRATTVSSGDYRVRSLDVPRGFRFMSRLALGVTKPRKPTLGSELAGDIEAAGKDVRTFKVGDPVIAFLDTAMGCHAEYRCVPADGKIAPKPANLTYEQAATLCFGGTTALHFLRKAKLAPGEKVLVNGASGAVGTACVQLAQYFGAEVTGVCSTANTELVRSLGAKHVIDYTAEDFTQSGEKYDVIIDTVGNAPFKRSKRALSEHGRLLAVHASLAEMLKAPIDSLINKQKVIGGMALARPDDLTLLAQLAEDGILRPVIDRTYHLDEIAEAHRHVESRRKRGNVVVTIG